MRCSRGLVNPRPEGDAMTARSALLSSVAAIAVLSLSVATIASAQVVRRSSGDGADVMARPYGTTPGEENQPMVGSTRDASGNRVIVNGMYVNGGTYSSQDGLTYGVGRRNSSSGVNASVIGNSLNVVVAGNNNVVVVNSHQDNSGNQTVVLNGGLNLE